MSFQLGVRTDQAPPSALNTIIQMTDQFLIHTAGFLVGSSKYQMQTLNL